MPAYRLYALDEDDRINLADWIEADSDADAIRQAKTIEEGRRLCEVWQGNRMVATLRSNDLANSSNS